MVTHYNPTIAEDAARILNTKSADTLSSQVMPLTPVIEIKRFADLVRSTGTVNQASATLYTTPTDKDFYLTSVTLSCIKDATSTSTYQAINITDLNNVARQILKVPTITLTAQTYAITQSFYYPILIKKGTVIQIEVQNGAVANISTQSQITGYLVETTKGV